MVIKFFFFLAAIRFVRCSIATRVTLCWWRLVMLR